MREVIGFIALVLAVGGAALVSHDELYLQVVAVIYAYALGAAGLYLIYSK